MDKEFCTYEQALSLKELGFNEPCLKMTMSDIDIINAERTDEGDYPKNSDLFSGWVAIPTYSAAFRWFREKHQLHISIDAGISGYYGHLKINPIGTLSSQVKQEWINTEEYPFKTYEEAEQACLDKLIEICKNK